MAVANIHAEPGFRNANPFVPVSWSWRCAILAYVVIYNMILPGVGATLGTDHAPWAVERLLAAWAYQALLFLPLFFYRPSYGWLHPLVFPVVFDLAVGVVRAPEHLLVVFTDPTRWADVGTNSSALVGLSPQEIALARLEYTLVQCLALTVYYGAFFFGPRIPVPRLAFNQVSGVRWKAMAAISASLIVLAVYVASRGGLSAHVLSFTGSRFQALGGDGPIIVAVKAAPIALVVWYALDRAGSRSPYFWIVALGALPVGFVAQGSRSGMLYPVILLLMVWMLRYRRLPKVRSFVIAVVAFALFGALGQIRNDSRAREVDWSILTRPDLGAWLESAWRDAQRRRAQEAGLVVIAKGPDVGLLYGQTYVAAALFWVPRALWEGKPRGVGAYNAALLFGERELQGSVPQGGGIPPGPVAEAFWNFHVPGVILIFGLYGLLQQWLTRLLQTYPSLPSVWIVYAIVLLYFHPGTITMVNCFHALLPALLLLCWMGAVRPRFIPGSATHGS